MNTFASILLIIVALIWLCVSIFSLISTIQSFIYDRKREAREKEAQKRDLEYHKARMKTIEK